MEKQLETDVAIIGAGATGTGIARELSRYKLDAIVVDKANYIGAGQTKASPGTLYGEGLMQVGSYIMKSIMAPNAPLYDPNSLRLKLMREGVAMWPRILEELDLEYEEQSTMVIARNKKELAGLEQQLRIGRSIGGKYADMRWVSKEDILNLEPYLNKNVIAGLYSEGQTVLTHAWDVAIAMSENARQNGVRIMLGTEVTGLSKKNGYQLVDTTQGPIKAKFVVNAAGLFADVVADMAGGRNWGLHHPRNTLIILDRRVSRYVKTWFMTPALPGEFGGLCPTVGGNILLNVGPYVEARHKYDLSSHRYEFIRSMRLAKQLIPRISEKDIIRAYVGIRCFNDRDPEEHILEPSSTNPKFINVAVRLPGLTPSPAIAKYVVNLLGDAGLELTIKPDFNPYRKAIPRFRDLNNDARAKLVAQDPRYGRVICRCETITEGEIVEAIKRGARTLAGVKYMTRAGMGRCQSGFCGPRVVSIIARELNIPVTEVRDFGVGSPVVPYRSKELL